MNMSPRYIGATARAILPAKRVQIVFGVISPKIKRISVTAPVARARPYSPGSSSCSAIARALTVASADAQTFTRLFPIRIVISNLSLSSLIRSRDFDPHRFSRLNHSIACFESVMSAISVPEKKADKTISTINKSIWLGSNGRKVKSKWF